MTSISTQKEMDNRLGYLQDRTDIINAVKRGDINTVSLILSRRPRLISAVSVYSMVPEFELVPDSHRWDMIFFLLERGAPLDPSNYSDVFIRAVNAGHVDTARFFLDRGADVNESTTGGRTMLMDASRLGYEGMVRLLLSRGTDVNRKDGDDQTALIYASIKGFNNIVQILIDANADMNVRDRYGRTALQYAILRGNLRTIAFLAMNGARE